MALYLIVYGYNNAYTSPSNCQFNLLIKQNIGDCRPLTANALIVITEKTANEIYEELSHCALYNNHPEIFLKTLLITPLSKDTEFPSERPDIIEWITKGI